MFNVFSTDWFNNHYGYKPSIAIIGNSSNVLDERMGAYIDNFDVVCRMNNYQIESYENYVGSKTSLYVTSLSNRPEKTKQDLVKQNIESVFVTRPLSAKYAYNAAIGEMLKNYGIVKDMDPVFVSEQTFDEMYNLLDLNNENNGKNPTSGLTFLYVLLKKVEFKTIFITGFDFFDPLADKMHYYKGDFFDKKENIGLISQYHSRNSEIKIFQNLIAGKENVILSAGVKKCLRMRE